MAGGIYRDSAHYRIGPLTTYADETDLRAWHRDAEIGDAMPYAIGPALGEKSATARLARSLRDSGEAILFLERREGRLHYMIRKRAKPEPARQVRIESAVPPGPQRQLYHVLCELASDGLMLPSLEDLAELARLSDRKAAHYRLNQLSSAGIVRVATVNGSRIVEIVATGLRTARPASQGGADAGS